MLIYSAFFISIGLSPKIGRQILFIHIWPTQMLNISNLEHEGNNTYNTAPKNSETPVLSYDN